MLRFLSCSEEEDSSLLRNITTKNTASHRTIKRSCNLPHMNLKPLFNHTLFSRLRNGMKWLMTRSTGEGNELSAAVTIGVPCPADWIPVDCAVHARWHLLLMQWTEFLPTANGTAGDTCYIFSGLNTCRIFGVLQVTPVTYSVDWIPADDCSVHAWRRKFLVQRCW